MAKIYPVYIPSKGRSTNDTSKLCVSEKIPYKIAVEPQDADDYIRVHGEDRCLVMGENNKGLAYVRRFIKAYSIAQGEKWHWQIDDDMKCVKERIDNKNVKVSAKIAMTEIQDFVDSYKNIGLTGLCHSLFAWTHSTDYGLNKSPPSFVLIRNEVPVWWRDDTQEDTDYTLQVLTANRPNDLLNDGTDPWCTVLFYKYMFDTAVQGKLAGGLTDMADYSSDDIRLQRIKKLQEFWPGCFTYVWKHESWRVAPSRIWQTFKQPLIRRENNE